MNIITIFYVIILIFSVIIHEISHGYVALMLGDTTAKDAGRLTLNPLAHIDLFGTILFPLILAISGAPVFGWAKPVPYDPRFLKNPKKGEWTHRDCRTSK
jgi:Zn-dependent protease